MLKLTSFPLVIALWLASAILAADLTPLRVGESHAFPNTALTYYWRVTPVADSAQLVTLFCRTCNTAVQEGDVPLAAVLRDTLGDQNTENDRLTDFWLLTYTPHTVGQRVLAGVPFFYWRLGNGSDKVDPKQVKPLMDLTTPEHSVVTNGLRDVVQWTAFDPLTFPVRASSRAYRTNEVDQERLHLEEAIGYLREAPTGTASDSLTPSELNLLIARLQLRERLLGGIVTRRKAEAAGQQEGFEQERIRSHDWELLRVFAEKTGLLFEPISVGGTQGEYALLWFPLDESSPPQGTNISALWKVLDLQNPWTDERLKHWQGPVFTRAVDQNGSLVPEGAAGARQIRLVALGAYSLDYPKLPLLLIDFRDEVHIKKHEITQRTINELTAGVIGVSHFTNWYYYLGADLYDFVSARHGTAMNLSSRLDCYAQFRSALALDSNLDSRLRDDMQRRINSLSVNPLEGSARRELQAAMVRYKVLESETEGDSPLTRRLDKQRRAELAAFDSGAKGITFDALLHGASLGLYTKRAQPDPAILSKLDADRRVQNNLDFLESVTEGGTRPEIAYDTNRITNSVQELSSLLPQVRSESVRTRAHVTIDHLRGLTQDEVLQADCSSALTALNNSNPKKPTTGIAARPRRAEASSLTIAGAGQ